MPDIFHNYVYCSKCPLPSFGIYKTTGAERERDIQMFRGIKVRSNHRK